MLQAVLLAGYDFVMTLATVVVLLLATYATAVLHIH